MKIICLTSNNYVNVLPGFAHLFNLFWNPETQVEVVRYDVRPPRLPANFTNFAIGNQSDYSWSSGLKYYLNHITDEFVLLMLEDYYLDRPVDNEIIEMLNIFMIINKDVMKIDLTDDRLKVKHESFNRPTIMKMTPEKFDSPIELIQSDLEASFLASVQAAIWRKDFLLGILNKTDNPWQFEKNKRTKTYLKKHDGVILGCVNPPVSYVNAVGGEGHKPGEYDLKKIPQWMIDDLKANNVWSEK